jgi:hypothetical protein
MLHYNPSTGSRKTDGYTYPDSASSQSGPSFLDRLADREFHDTEADTESKDKALETNISQYTKKFENEEYVNYGLWDEYTEWDDFLQRIDQEQRPNEISSYSVRRRRSNVYDGFSVRSAAPWSRYKVGRQEHDAMPDKETNPYRRKLLRINPPELAVPIAQRNPSQCKDTELSPFTRPTEPVAHHIIRDAKKYPYLFRDKKSPSMPSEALSTSDKKNLTSVTSLSIPNKLRCKDCDAQYTGVWATRNLDRHRRTNHLGVSTKTYACATENCAQTFQRQERHLNHYRVRHPHLIHPRLIGGVAQEVGEKKDHKIVKVQQPAQSKETTLDQGDRKISAIEEHQTTTETSNSHGLHHRTTTTEPSTVTKRSMGSLLIGSAYAAAGHTSRNKQDNAHQGVEFDISQQSEASNGTAHATRQLLETTEQPEHEKASVAGDASELSDGSLSDHDPAVRQCHAHHIQGSNNDLKLCLGSEVGHDDESIDSTSSYINEHAHTPKLVASPTGQMRFRDWLDGINLRSHGNTTGDAHPTRVAANTREGNNSTSPSRTSNSSKRSSDKPPDDNSDQLRGHKRTARVRRDRRTVAKDLYACPFPKNMPRKHTRCWDFAFSKDKFADLKYGITSKSYNEANLVF